MNEMKETTLENRDTLIEKDYRQNEIPAIHNIGQSTMIIGCLLMYIPGLIMYFAFGWNEIPLSQVLAFAAMFLPMSAGSQFSEHLQYYPLMGSASTYIGYLSGNVSGMRLPVASTCAAAFDEDVLSAKGQIVAVVGVAVSVVANIVVLLIIILFGSAILSLLPPIVRSAMDYITVALFGYLLCTNIRGVGKGSILKGFMNAWPWVLVAIVGKVVFQQMMHSSMYILLTLALAIAVGFVMEIIKEKRQSRTEF